jgi:DNA repair exonuclease SbcCD ATPase subunit
MLEQDIAELSGRKDILDQQLRTETARMAEIEHLHEVYAKAVEILDMAQISVRANIKSGFESIVTYALQFILGTGYRFELDFGRRGKLQEVDLCVKNDALDVPADPMVTSGGGVLGIVALALRVAILELHKPKIEGPVVLDESFKHLSREYLFTAGEFLNALNERVGRQIIMVSHKSELVKMASNAVEIKKGAVDGRNEGGNSENSS